MCKYKASLYNILSEASDGGILIQNHLYNSNIKVSLKYKKILLPFLEEGEYEAKEIPFAKTLIDKKIFIETNIDEKEMVDYYCNSIVYSNDVLHISIIPTDACNFRCKYCYESSQIHVMDQEIVSGIKKYLTRVARKYKGIYISWYGGEPTLAIDYVVEIMEHARKVCQANSIPLYSQMTTNGYLLTSDIFKVLLSNHVLSYMITIDGTRETHNIQRPHKTDNDSYSVILQNLKNIRDQVHNKNFRIGIRINISPQILPVLKNYVDIMSSQFGNDRRFGIIWEWVKDWGGEQICQNYDLVMDSYDSTEYEQYLDYITQMGLQIDRGQAHSQLGSEMCIASRKNGYTINFDGNIYKCAMAIYDKDLDKLNCVGRLLPNGEVIIDEGINALWVGQGNLPKGCYNCKHYPECMGLLCPLAMKIRKVFSCPRILAKEEEYIARNLEKVGKFTLLEDETKL